MLGGNFILGLGPLSQDLSTVKPRVTFLCSSITQSETVPIWITHNSIEFLPNPTIMET